MKTVVVQNNQSIYDIAIQEYGTSEGIKQLIIDNPTVCNFSDDILPGTKLFINGEPFNPQIVDYLKTKGITPATQEAFSVAPPPSPVITVSLNSLSFGTTKLLQSSASQNYIVSGSNLIAPVTITAPYGFIINTDNSNTNQSPIILYPSLGVLAATTIYVKFVPLIFQVFNTNVMHTSTGATNKAVLLSGTGDLQATLKTWYNSLTVKTSAAATLRLQKLFQKLEDDSNLDYDFLQVTSGLETTEQRYKPIITSSGLNIVAVGSPSYSFVGFKPIGTQYLNLKWNPQSHSNHYTKQNGGITLYSLTNSDTNGASMGSRDTIYVSQMRTKLSGSTFDGGINRGSMSSQANLSSNGFFSTVRKNGNKEQLTINNITYEFTIVDDGAFVDKEMYLGAINNNGTAADFSKEIIGFVAISGSTQNKLNEFNAVKQYLSECGLI